VVPASSDLTTLCCDSRKSAIERNIDKGGTNQKYDSEILKRKGTSQRKINYKSKFFENSLKRGAGLPYNCPCVELAIYYYFHTGNTLASHAGISLITKLRLATPS